MATRKRAPQTLGLDAASLADADYSHTLDYSDDSVAPLCPSCGELLAWHETACSTTTAAQPDAPSAAQAVPGTVPAGFAFALRQPVQPAPNAQPCPIIWRGQVKARHPGTGLVQRVNVYRLDNGYWDCYYESDLQVA